MKTPIVVVILVALTIALSAITLHASPGHTASPQDIPTSSATVPVCEGFESGTLPTYMSTEVTTAGSGTGLVQISTDYPHTGSRAIHLISRCNASQCFGTNYTRQALLLSVDLAGVSGPELNFWVRENYMAGNNAEDGVFISDDGGSTWARIHDLNTATAVYQHVVIDLQAAATDAGMGLVDGFLIKFQSYEKVPLSYDDLEYSLDDICVQQGQPLLENSTKVAQPVVVSGRTLTYTIAISNTGASTATATSLVDPLPAGTTYVPGSATNGATYNAGQTQVEWTGDVGPDEMVDVSFAVTATASAGSALVNSATISNTALSAAEVVSATTSVASAAPLGTCADFEGGVLPGHMVTETSKYGRAQVTNRYPYLGDYALDLDSDSSYYSQRGAIVVADLAGATNVEVSAWVRSYGGSDHSTTGIFISNDGGLTYTKIGYLPMEENPYTNVVFNLSTAAADASVSLTDGFIVKFQSYSPSSIPYNGHSLDHICVQSVQPHLESSIKGACAVGSGSPYPFVISLENTGIVSATGVTLVDPIPTGTQYVADSVSGGAAYNPTLDRIEWTGIVTAGEEVRLSFTVTSTAPTVVTNTATISYTGMSAPLILEDNTTPVFDPYSVPITITKRLFNTPSVVNVGEWVDYELQVENGSPYTFCEWQIRDEYEGCLDYEGASRTPDGTGSEHVLWSDAGSLGGPLWPGDRRTVLVYFRAAQGDYACVNRSTFQAGAVWRESPITITVEGPRIHLTKTVGTDPNACAATKTITVPVGTDVTYCYQAENKGTWTFDRHTLKDTELGDILSYEPIDLDQGETTFVTRTATITQTTINTATWEAKVGFSTEATDTDYSTVFVESNLLLTKTVGTDPSACAATQAITVESGTQVVYCYAALNTGVYTLTTHDLIDDKLGAIRSSYAYTLPPGASTYVTATATITRTTINLATWTASDGVHGSDIGMASARVNVADKKTYLPLVLRNHSP